MFQYLIFFLPILVLAVASLHTHFLYIFLADTQIILLFLVVFFLSSSPSLSNSLCIPCSSRELACLLLIAWLMPRNPDSWYIIAGL